MCSRILAGVICLLGVRWARAFDAGDGDQDSATCTATTADGRCKTFASQAMIQSRIATKLAATEAADMIMDADDSRSTAAAMEAAKQAVRESGLVGTRIAVQRLAMEAMHRMQLKGKQYGAHAALLRRTIAGVNQSYGPTNKELDKLMRQYEDNQAASQDKCPALLLESKHQMNALVTHIHELAVEITNMEQSLVSTTSDLTTTYTLLNHTSEWEHLEMIKCKKRQEVDFKMYLTLKHELLEMHQIANPSFKPNYDYSFKPDIGVSTHIIPGSTTTTGGPGYGSTTGGSGYGSTTGYGHGSSGASGYGSTTGYGLGSSATTGYGTTTSTGSTTTTSTGGYGHGSGSSYGSGSGYASGYGAVADAAGYQSPGGYFRDLVQQGLSAMQAEAGNNPFSGLLQEEGRVHPARDPKSAERSDDALRGSTAGARQLVQQTKRLAAELTQCMSDGGHPKEKHQAALLQEMALEMAGSSASEANEVKQVEAKKAFQWPMKAVVADGAGWQANPMVADGAAWQAKPVVADGAGWQARPVVADGAAWQAKPVVADGAGWQAKPVVADGAGWQARAVLDGVGWQTKPVADGASWQPKPVGDLAGWPVQPAYPSYTTGYGPTYSTTTTGGYGHTTGGYGRPPPSYTSGYGPASPSYTSTTGYGPASPSYSTTTGYGPAYSTSGHSTTTTGSYVRPLPSFPSYTSGYGSTPPSYGATTGYGPSPPSYSTTTGYGPAYSTSGQSTTTTGGYAHPPPPPTSYTSGYGPAPPSYSTTTGYGPTYSTSGHASATTGSYGHSTSAYGPAPPSYSTSTGYGPPYAGTGHTTTTMGGYGPSSTTTAGYYGSPSYSTTSASSGYVPYSTSASTAGYGSSSAGYGPSTAGYASPATGYGANTGGHGPTYHSSSNSKSHSSAHSYSHSSRQTSYHSSTSTASSGVYSSSSTYGGTTGTYSSGNAGSDGGYAASGGSSTTSGGYNVGASEACQYQKHLLQSVYIKAYIEVTRLVAQYEVLIHSHNCEDWVHENEGEREKVLKEKQQVLFTTVRSWEMKLQAYKVRIQEAYKAEFHLRAHIKELTTRCQQMDKTISSLDKVRDAIHIMGVCPGLGPIHFHVPVWIGYWKEAWFDTVTKPDALIDEEMNQLCQPDSQSDDEDASPDYKPVVDEDGKGVKKYRAAESSELMLRTLEGEPKTNTAYIPVMGTCPNCEGDPDDDSDDDGYIQHHISHHSRVCWNPDAELTTDYRRMDCNAGRKAVLCVEEYEYPSSKPVPASELQLQAKENSTQIPSGCTSWFDGCHTCHAMQDGIWDCSNNDCSGVSMPAPYCLALNGQVIAPSTSGQ